VGARVPGEELTKWFALVGKEESEMPSPCREKVPQVLRHQTSPPVQHDGVFGYRWSPSVGDCRVHWAHGQGEEAGLAKHKIFCASGHDPHDTHVVFRQSVVASLVEHVVPCRCVRVAAAR
jgi:hypothetical protein